MKKTTLLAGLALIALTLLSVSCKKDKKTESPSEPPITLLPPEVITTLKLYIWDSLTHATITGSPFTFKDADGEGGQPGTFLNGGADSVITLAANTSYKTRVVILDESASPVDSISNDVAGDESYEHMFFYNGNPANSPDANGVTVITSNPPGYLRLLNGSHISIRYTDTDNGSIHGLPARNIGLTTILKTAASTNGISHPFITTLRHQPGAKDGTYAPGETDIEVTFKIKIN